MKTIKISIIVLLILIFYFLFSCNKDEQINYPIEPHLDFKKIEIDKVLDVLGNNYIVANLILDYTDGDANLGKEISSSEENPVYNCFITTYKKTNGIFYLISDSLNYGNPIYCKIYKIKNPYGVNYMGPITISSKSLFEGELSIEVPYYSNPFNIGDTLKYVVQVSDTDDNLSNRAEMIKIFPFTNN